MSHRADPNGRFIFVSYIPCRCAPATLTLTFILIIIISWNDISIEGLIPTRAYLPVGRASARESFSIEWMVATWSQCSVTTGFMLCYSSIGSSDRAITIAYFQVYFKYFMEWQYAFIRAALKTAYKDMQMWCFWRSTTTCGTSVLCTELPWVVRRMQQILLYTAVILGRLKSQELVFKTESNESQSEDE